MIGVHIGYLITKLGGGGTNGKDPIFQWNYEKPPPEYHLSNPYLNSPPTDPLKSALLRTLNGNLAAKLQKFNASLKSFSAHASRLNILKLFQAIKTTSRD